MDVASGNLSPNLQASFCKPSPADFVDCNLLVFVFLAFRICCVSFSSKISPDDPRCENNWVGRVPAAPSAQVLTL